MKKDYGYPSYDLIYRASNGDEKAVRGILDFYNAYISKVCLRPCYHANGTVNMQVDE
ncbi:helix-turn-helix domain-containing protein, partial [[Clostridium] innocuum]|nr:helix-turn-helix domain-containing protein [[Clostridium] innocuum]